MTDVTIARSAVVCRTHKERPGFPANHTARRGRLRCLTDHVPHQEIASDLVAEVAAVHVSVGDQVEAGQELVLLESMKMEIPVTPEFAGTVTAVRVRRGDVVQEGEVLVIVTD